MKFLVYNKYSINVIVIVIIIILLLLLLQKYTFLCFLKPQVSANDKVVQRFLCIHTQENSFWRFIFFIMPLPQTPLVSHHPDHKYLSEPSSLLIKWSLKKIPGICFNCGLKSFPHYNGLWKCLEFKNEVSLNKISSFWSFMYSNLIVYGEKNKSDDQDFSERNLV